MSKTELVPVDFITMTQAILAQKGKGKSYAAAVQAEHLMDLGSQVVIIDPTGAHWGLRSSPDGKSTGYAIAVLGGEHGDVPLEATAGELIADAIAAEHFSCVIDLSLFRKGESLRFMAAFLETLYRRNRSALHMFIDEADFVAPQKTFSPDQARALGAAEDIVRRGRIRGIGCTLITQRPQVINKDVLSQVDMLTTLGMNHPKDLGAISDWVAVHGDPKQAERMIESLPALPRGEAWVWAPARDLFKRIQVPERVTFDSGRTPKPGERALIAKVLAPVDIKRLGAAIAATAERARSDDPKVLRGRVHELEKKLEAVTANASKATTERHRAEARGIDPKQLAQLDKLGARFEKAVAAFEKRAVTLDAELQDVRGLAVETMRAITRAINSAHQQMSVSSEVAGIVDNRGPRVRPERPNGQAVPASYQRQHVERRAAAESGTLSKMERAMLITLAQHPEGLTKRKVRVHTGYADSGPVSKAFARLLAQGWITTTSHGGLEITDGGLRELGGYEPLPTGRDLQAHLLGNGSRLSQMERKMLAVICEAHPRSISKSEIRERAGYADSGPVSKAFAKLVAMDYVAPVGRGELVAAEELF